MHVKGILKMEYDLRSDEENQLKHSRQQAYHPDPGPRGQDDTGNGSSALPLAGGKTCSELALGNESYFPIRPEHGAAEQVKPF